MSRKIWRSFSILSFALTICMVIFNITLSVNAVDISGLDAVTVTNGTENDSARTITGSHSSSSDSTSLSNTVLTLTGDSTNLGQAVGDLTFDVSYTLKPGAKKFGTQGTAGISATSGVTANSKSGDAWSDNNTHTGTDSVTVADWQSGSTWSITMSASSAYRYPSYETSSVSVTISNIVFTEYTSESVTFVGTEIPYTVNYYAGATAATTSTATVPANSAGVEVELAPLRGVTITAGDYYYCTAVRAVRDEVTITLPMTDGTFYPQIGDMITPSLVQDWDKDGTAPFLVDGENYWLWNDAMAAAQSTGSSGEVILNEDYTLPASSETYIVPSGVTFLVPYNDANTLRGALVEDTINSSVPAGVVSYDSYGSTVTSEYRRLTMSSGSSIAVNGTLEVGSMTHPMAKGQLGPYGLIQMEKGSSITVNAGAELFAWGYIRGSGTVTVNPNAVVYENFDATDYPGSAGNMNKLNQAKVFAMKEYSLNNVEVEMTVNAGATVKGAICIYGQQIQYNTFVKTFVGSGDSDMIQLTSGTLKKSYVSSRQKFVLDGEAKVNPFNITITYIISYKVDSSQTSGLPFPSNWDFTVSSGSMVPNDSILLLAGATVTINEGASIVIPSGKNVYVFDAAEDPKGAGRNDAKVDVNGTVTVNGAFYTTESGANITSSLGGGSVVCAASGTATTVKLKNGSSTAGTYNITPAKLKNGDGTYTETAGAAATYTYCGECGFWETHEEPVAKIVGGSSEGIRKHYHSLQDAVDDYTSGTGYVQMVAASGADCDINKAVYLDLNGKTVTGVSVTGTLHGIDSATNGFGDAVGYIQLTNGSAEKVAANPVDAKDNYVAVTKDGKTTFNRFDIPVTDYYLEIDADGNAKVGFAAAFRGNAAAASALEDMGFIINGDATPLWGTANSLELSKVTDKYRIFYTYPTTNWEEHSALGVVKYGGVTYKGDEQATAFNFTEILDNYEGAGQDVITAFWKAVNAAEEGTT